MPQLEYFIVAGSFAVDQFANRVSAFDIIEEITPPSLPTAINRAVLISSWRIQEHEKGTDYQITLKLQGACGDLEHDFAMNFTPEGPRHRLFQNLVNIPINNAGTIRIALKLNGEDRAHHEIIINEKDSDTRMDGLLSHVPNPNQYHEENQNDGEG